MKHLGDITKIKGCEAPVVDCIIGGSPCQDLSVAGKRAGLAGERSGLYMEQIRIIKEMRHRDELRGRTGESIRPRYMVWENVPGAFSSNGGKDFAAVIEEAVRVAEPEAPNVPVPEKGWPTSGCFMGDTWSVAWRVLDAQFWGVPQRRRRIALVADFGGQSAPEILFIRKGVSRDFDESKSARKATARDAENCSGADDRTGAVGFPLGFRPENVRCYDEVATTLCNGTRPDFTTGVVQPIAFDTYNMDVAGDKTVTLRAGAEHNYAPVFQPKYLFENHSQDSRYKVPLEVSPMLSAQFGTGGNNTPLVMESVVYGISPYHSNCMLSDIPHSGYYEADTARTLDALQCGYPGCNQGGMAVVEPSVVCCETFHCTTEYDIAQPLKAIDCKDPLVVAHGVDCRNATEYEDQTGALQSSACHNMNSNNVVRVRYIVRRLTPLECERLQGYPDGWTDIGEWVDSKGKKHKEADSPRFKALGNSIALPPWKWVLKRLCACYERDATMASLFDGIGGFPYIWEQLNGKGSCLWASEIEEFPMAVTKLRFGGKS